MFTWRGGVAGGAAGGGGTVADCFLLLLPLVFLFFFCFCFFLFSSLLSLLFSLPSPLCCVFSLSHPPFRSPIFSLVLPCFYRKKIGETSWWGGHCWPPPPLPFPWITTLGNGERLFAQKTRKKVGEKGEEKSSSSPASRVQGKKKTYSAVKTAPFRAFVFFFFFCNSE